MAGVWLTDLADILRGAGIPVREMRYESGPYAHRPWSAVGYQGRGYTEFKGIMWHHDSSPVGDSGGSQVNSDGQGVSPTGALWWCMYGAFGYPPAAAIWVDRKGTWFVYASGMTNHAGQGYSPLSGQDRGNEFFLGIETDHTDNEVWPDDQINSLRLGTAAIMAAYGLDPMQALEFHKSYAPGRKNDPAGLDLGQERKLVSRLVEQMGGPEASRLERLRQRLAVVQDKKRAARAAGEPVGWLRKRVRELKEKIQSLSA